MGLQAPRVPGVKLIRRETIRWMGIISVQFQIAILKYFLAEHALEHTISPAIIFIR